jgi:hypothetical protein
MAGQQEIDIAAFAQGHQLAAKKVLPGLDAGGQVILVRKTVCWLFSCRRTIMPSAS